MSLPGEVQGAISSVPGFDSDTNFPRILRASFLRRDISSVSDISRAGRCLLKT